MRLELESVVLSIRAYCAYLAFVRECARRLVPHGTEPGDEFFVVRPDGGAWIAVPCRDRTIIFPIQPGEWGWALPSRGGTC